MLLIVEGRQGLTGKSLGGGTSCWYPDPRDAVPFDTAKDAARALDVLALQGRVARIATEDEVRAARTKR